MENISSIISFITLLVMLGLYITVGLIVFYSVRALIMYVRYKNVDDGVRAKNEIGKVKRFLLTFSRLFISFIALIIAYNIFDEPDDTSNEDIQQVELVDRAEDNLEGDNKDQEETPPEPVIISEATEIPEPEPEPEPEPIPEPEPASSPNPAPAPEPEPEVIPEPEIKYGEYVDENGNGIIKGTDSGIYHTPSSSYYGRITNVKQYFKSIEEAEAAGYRAPKR